MGFEYFLYDTNFNNTLVDRGDSSFAPLPPNTGEIFIDFLIPNTQPLYLYKESSSSIVLNDQSTIDDYLNATDHPTGEDSVDQDQFTGYTATTQTEIDGKLDSSGGTISGALGIGGSASVGGSIVEGGIPLSTKYLGITPFNVYSAQTKTNINNKVDVSGGGITFEENNVPVAGAPHDTLNFDNNFTVTDEGSGKATVSLGTGMGADGLCELNDTAGGQQINNIVPVAMTWDTNEFIDTNYYTHTLSGSNITVLTTGLYEASYLINAQLQTNTRATSGVQIRVNGTLVGKTLTACYARNNTNSLPATTLSLTANDVIDVVLFRLGANQSILTKPNASFVRIKYMGS